MNGKELALRIREKVKMRIQIQKANPGLAVLLVGNDPASHTYVRIKQKACEETGIHFEKYLYPEDTGEKELIAKIEELNVREDIHGILVQVPLPKQDANRVIAAIDPKKDVDGFHQTNLRLLKKGERCLAPPVALGVMKLVDASVMDPRGLLAIIVSSDLFAKPLTILLRERGVAAERVDPEDKELAEITKTADILVVAVGRPGFITEKHIKHGATVIDVGTTKVAEKIVGDVDVLSVENTAGWLSPVPGGVGPMTVAMLLMNVLKAYDWQKLRERRAEAE